MQLLKQYLSYENLARTRTQYEILLVLASLTFAAALFCGFVHFDDQNYILNNPQVLNGDFSAAVTKLHSGLYKPVVLLLFTLEYKLFGANPFIYHYNNIMFHVFNVLLLYCLFFKISKSRFVAFCSAALFAVHPLRVESVVWIAERKDVLYLFFMLLSFVFYLSFKETCKKSKYVFSLFLMFLSLTCKPMAVTLPLMLILADWFLGQKITLKNQLNKLPYFALSALFTFMPLMALTDKTIAIPKYGFGALNHLLVPFYSVYFYIYKTVLPFNLSHYYDYPNTIWPLVAGAVAGFIIFLCVYFAAYKNPNIRRPLLFGFTLFLISLLPVSGLVTFHGPMVTDRFTYFAQTGLFFAFFYSLLPIWNKYKNDVKIYERAVCLFFGILLILCALTVNRTFAWRSSAALWADTVKKSPKSPYALGFAGNFYQVTGDYAKAFDYYSKSLEFDASSVSTHYNRANIAQMLGKNEIAFKDYEYLLANDPQESFIFAYTALLLKTGRYKEAAHYAHQLDHDNLDVIALLIRSHMELKDYAKVKELYAKAQKINPAYKIPDEVRKVIEGK